MLTDPGMKVSLVTLIINIALSGYKLVVGLLAHSTAMLADGIHSLSDVLTTVIVMVSLGISKKPADKEHPYGHGRAESIAAKVLGLALMLVAFSVAKTGIESLLKSSTIPGQSALWAALISIIIKEAMYQVTVNIGREQKSQALIADAWHHRSDAFSSIGTSIGIFAARRGLYFMDGLAALIVSVLIFRLGLSIWKKTVDEIMDTQKSEAMREKIVATCQQKGVFLNEDLLRLRHYGNSVFAEMTIGIPANATVYESHELAEQIREELINNIDSLKDVIIHIDPLDSIVS